MPAMGLEPIRCCHRQILSLVRLPFRHAGLLIIFSLPITFGMLILICTPIFLVCLFVAARLSLSACSHLSACAVFLKQELSYHNISIIATINLSDALKI